MGLRETIAKPQVGGLVVAVILVVAIVIAMTGMDPGEEMKTYDKLYYYDLNSSELFVEKANYAPIKAPSGGEGVEAFVYTCGKCDKSEWFIAWIQKYGPDARKYLTENVGDNTTLAKDTWVRKPDGSEWILEQSKEGIELQNTSCPQGGSIKQCKPE